MSIRSGVTKLHYWALKPHPWGQARSGLCKKLPLTYFGHIAKFGGHILGSQKFGNARAMPPCDVEHG